MTVCITTEHLPPSTGALLVLLLPDFPLLVLASALRSHEGVKSDVFLFREFFILLD